MNGSEKIEALYERLRDVFDGMTDEELLSRPWCLYCDHGEETEEETNSRIAEAEVCEWLLRRRGREDLLSKLEERLAPLGGTLLRSR